jgi:hypothetical protein
MALSTCRNKVSFRLQFFVLALFYLSFAFTQGKIVDNREVVPPSYLPKVPKSLLPLMFLKHRILIFSNKFQCLQLQS